MKRSLPPGVALLLVVLAPLASAQPLADRLPGSTMVYVGWSPSAALQNTAAARMLADERVMGPWRKLFHELIQQLPDMGAGQGASAHLPGLLREAVECEGCFALLELKQDKRKLAPQSVLMIDLGARRKAFEEHFKPINALMRERYGDSLKMMKLDNSWVWFRADRDGRPRLTWGFVGDVFVMFFGSTGEDFIPKLVKGQFQNNSLRSSTAFADTMGRLPGESVFSTYLDVKASFSLLRQLAKNEGGPDLQLFVNNWDKVLEELGVANVKGVAEKTTIEDRQFVTRTLARTDGPPRGLLAIAGQAGVEDAFLRTIPADAMMAGAWRLDLLKFLEQIKRSAVAIAGRDAEEGFRDLEQAAAGFGLPLNDVLGAFGDQWAIYNAQSQGGFALTGWTLIGTIRDAEKFKRSIDVLRGVLARAAGDGGAGGQNNAPRLRELDAD